MYLSSEIFYLADSQIIADNEGQSESPQTEADEEKRESENDEPNVSNSGDYKI